MPMSSVPQRLVVVALVSIACHPANTPNTAPATAGSDRQPSSAVAAQNAWWRSFADGDTAALRAQSAPAVALTLSNGRTFDHASMLAESHRYASLPHPTLEWSDTIVVPSADGRVALVTARLRETDPRGVTYARTLTVLERAGDGASGWRMLGAQSTREPQRYARLPAAATGDLTAYAGRYRVPNGVVRITVADSALSLTDPRGTVTRLEPVGPGLFEAVPPATTTDVVRLLFTRDETGRISALSRLAMNGLMTYPRVVEP